ncbi:MAG TPA: acetyltransferase [Humisphaera sp.]|nr:acetyltransferase [Humisphaera sp.]
MVADIVVAENTFTLRGFVEDVTGNDAGTEFFGKPIFRGAECLDWVRAQGVEHLLFGFGDCNAKMRLSRRAEERGFRFATAVHPRATIAPDVALGEGTVVMAGVVINASAILGRHVIVNTCASVDHDCVIEDAVHLSPGVHLAGGVEVGQGTWIGIGAVVAPKVRIGRGTIIGAGSVVLKDIPSHVVAWGSSARVMRSLPHEK